MPKEVGGGPIGGEQADAPAVGRVLLGRDQVLVPEAAQGDAEIAALQADRPGHVLGHHPGVPADVAQHMDLGGGEADLRFGLAAGLEGDLPGEAEHQFGQIGEPLILGTGWTWQGWDGDLL